MATGKLNPTEKQIQDVVMAWLQYHSDAFVWRQNAGMGISEHKGKRHVFRASSQPGISDIIGIWRGWPLAIEMKRPGNHPTDAQYSFLADWAKNGGIAIVATSLEDVKTCLGRYTSVNSEKQPVYRYDMKNEP